jgi:hypothetical protein
MLENRLCSFMRSGHPADPNHTVRTSRLPPPKSVPNLTLELIKLMRGFQNRVDISAARQKVIESGQ